MTEWTAQIKVEIGGGVGVEPWTGFSQLPDGTPDPALVRSKLAMLAASYEAAVLAQSRK